MNTGGLIIEIQRPSWEIIKQLVSSCKQELLICSPWLATSGLIKLQDYLGSASLHSVEFWARIADVNTDAELLLKMVTQLSALGIQVTVKDSPKLHAKIYLADRSRAILASSNISHSGFEQNLEIAISITEDDTIDKINAVVDDIKEEMHEISLQQLSYFVEKQRPQIVAQLSQVPTSDIVPIWRQIQTDNSNDVKIYAQQINNNSQVSTLGINPMIVYQAGLEFLDKHADKISALQINDVIGKKVKIVIYPANSNGWIDAMWADCEPPFHEFEGEIIGENKPFRVGRSFTSPLASDEYKMTWKFRPKRARTRLYILANFPVAPTFAEQIHYLAKIEVI